MKAVILCCIAILFAGVATWAQTLKPSTQLALDTGNRYYYQKSFPEEGKEKKALYQKGKTWVNTNLDPSDNYFMVDDAGNDSIRTMAYITIDDLPEVQNQVISFKVLLRFYNGSVDMIATGFWYSAMNKTNGDQIDQPLGHLKGLNPATQGSVIFAVDKKFRIMIQRLQHALD
ncbi:hypothetical protein [Taibaiella soli]|uniref:DUF4468 domain-containing protein n=1 Tax=Taibaiella soli TaxID=1649169 RepID=A0A2W2BHJ0_9BACT|nr:hypothetical protein [Taibaiella soli]PZF72966.1 hypothetical protein DN068_11180 [Taibaiella soli]